MSFINQPKNLQDKRAFELYCSYIKEFEKLDSYFIKDIIGKMNLIENRNIMTIGFGENANFKIKERPEYIIKELESTWIHIGKYSAYMEDELSLSYNPDCIDTPKEFDENLFNIILEILKHMSNLYKTIKESYDYDSLSKTFKLKNNVKDNLKLVISWILREIGFPNFSKNQLFFILHHIGYHASTSLNKNKSIKLEIDDQTKKPYDDYLVDVAYDMVCNTNMLEMFISSFKKYNQLFESNFLPDNLFLVPSNYNGHRTVYLIYNWIKKYFEYFLKSENFDEKLSYRQLIDQIYNGQLIDIHLFNENNGITETNVHREIGLKIIYHNYFKKRIDNGKKEELLMQLP